MGVASHLLSRGAASASWWVRIPYGRIHHLLTIVFFFRHLTLGLCLVFSMSFFLGGTFVLTNFLELFFFCKAHKPFPSKPRSHVTILGSSVWLVQEGWWVYDGNQQSTHPWDTSTISCLTIVHLRTNLPWSMVTWMMRGWSRDPMILKTMEPRSFCDCCCGVWNFWNMETFKRKLIESFWHEPPPNLVFLVNMRGTLTVWDIQSIPSF